MALDRRAVLLADRTATSDRLRRLTHDFNGVVEAAKDTATDDEHDPEGQTIAYERAQLAAMLDQAHAHLLELDAALDRLQAGTYGRCETCGAAISADRLDARPTARTCIACASAR